MKLLIGLVGVLGVFLLSSFNWRQYVKAVFFILVLEGVLRKWVLPQASDLLYFMKDFVLIGAYIKYYLASDHNIKNKKSIINVIIFFVVLWCSFQAFNPSLGSPIVGIIGLKAYILNIPLIWMIPKLFQSEEELYRFLRLHLLLAIPVCILGIIQFFSPPSSPINLYTAGDVTSVATFGAGGANITRITGPFSYIDTYVVYLIVCFGLLVVLVSLNQSRWWRWLSIAEILLVTINSFMTGSRSCVFASVLFLAGYLGIRGLSQPSSTLLWLRQFLAPALVIFIAASIWFKPAIDAFWLRTNSNQDVSGRVSHTFTQPLDFVKYKGLDGYGTGATQPGGWAIRNALGLPAPELIPASYEEEPGRIVLEIGPIGFILWYGLRLSILIALWLVFWKLKRPFLRQLALAAFLIQAIQFSDQLVTQHTFSVYYWFLSSFVFLLPRLEQIENWHREQQLLQQNVPTTYIPSSPYQ
ncbi:MAG: hypothetical protein F6K55_04875 [Moorea sp. SIO4A3]|nr:hypothetical protein [Moorena sp. SIO4A3]